MYGKHTVYMYTIKGMQTVLNTFCTTIKAAKCLIIDVNFSL